MLIKGQTEAEQVQVPISMSLQLDSSLNFYMNNTKDLSMKSSSTYGGGGEVLYTNLDAVE